MVKSKRNRKTKKCFDCSLPIDYRSLRCKSCSNKNKGVVRKSRDLKKKYYCVNCRSIISKKKYKRCQSCNMRLQWSKKDSPLVAALNRNYKQRTSKLQDAFEDKLFSYGFIKNMRVGRYVADYLNKFRKIIIEINGDYWHCNPDNWDKDRVHPHLGTKAIDIWERDKKRNKELEHQGYHVIVVWESEITKDFNIAPLLEPFNLTQNLVDKYKGKDTKEIIEDLEKNKNGFAVCLENWQYNYNIGSCIRNANAFGANKVYYVGNKKIDTRSAVGALHWMDVEHLESIDDLKKIKSEYIFVGFDNNVDNVHSLQDFNWTGNVLMIFGNESNGLSDEVLKMCDVVVEIPQHGSVRSLNAATTSGIAMYDFTTKRNY